MQQDLDSLMAGTIASPPPTTSVHAALQGLLSENGTGGEFADLLAEFTLPRHAMSPEALGRSPGVSAGGSAREDAGEGYHQSTTREQHLLAHLGLAAKDTGHGYGYGVEQERSVAVEQAGHLADAIAGLDPASQSQLLAALLSQASAASTAAPMQPYQQPPQFGRRDSSPASYRSQPRQPDQRPSPSHLSQPSSRHGSPQAFHMHDAAGSPYHQQQQYQVAVSIAQQAAMNASLPPSLVSSPLASPHMHATTPSPYYAQRSPLEQFQQQQLQQQQLQQQVQQQQQQQQQFAMHLAHGHTGSPLQAFPQPPLVQNGFARQAYSNSGYPVDSQSPGGGQYGPTPGSDRRGRGRSATGESYATTADTEEWRENEFLFSPLMSPALTPHSVYSQASSLPPSASCLPPNHQSMNLVSPSDFFSPLSSPAIMPVTYGTDFNATGVWTAPQQLPINATLQGLVDQTQALAFDPVTLSALQGSPHLYAQGQNMSPRMVAVDAGMSTATGSGRRGASSKKARPSPLLKATPDVVPKRKKAPSGSEKRANSISNGGRSATTSPFMGPTYGTVASSSGLTRSSPPEGLLDGSSGSVNTPSPVDLAMNGDVSTKYLPELMGPPPPPSSSSRRTSLIGDPGIDTATWLNPVTPATFMNFPSDLGAAGLSSLAPQFPTHHYPDVKGTFPDTTPLGLESISADTSGSSTATGSTAAAKGKGKKVTAKAAALSAAAAAGTSIAAVKGKGKAATTTGTLGTRKLAAKPAKLAMKPPVAGSGLSDSVSRAAARAVGDDGDSAPPAVDNRRTSHKAAEQKRRDSLKQCFEELRRILPPLADGAQNDEDRRPGEGNVGGQRGGSVDPENPNRGVSKVALLRRSNEFVGTLYDRVDRRDLAIEALRAELERVRAHAGVEGGFNLDGFHLDNLDKDEKQAGTMESYECLDSDDETDYRPKPKKAIAVRRKSTNLELDTFKPPGSRRSAPVSFGPERNSAHTRIINPTQCGDRGLLSLRSPDGFCGSLSFTSPPTDTISLYETARGSYQELPSQYQHETTVLIEEESLLHDMKAVTHHRGRMAQLWIAVVPFLVAIGLLVLSFAPATTSEISQRIPRPHLSWSRGGIHARDSGTSCVPGTPPPAVPPPVTNSSSNYKLVQDCSGTNFFSCFNFFMQPDPTNGQVNYVGQSDAVAAGLVSSTPQSSIMRADYRTDLLAGMRRNSIRIESKAAVPLRLGSLIVADIIRMPYGCGTWPAFWTYGTQSTWPAGGEIDILEGVNLQTHNQYTLHTSSSACKIDPNAVTKSSLMPNNNDCNSFNNFNAGCSYLDSSSASYGQGLNADGGGVWATLFAPSGISIWFWPRSQVPANILTPDYTKWGPPSATWPSTSCSMSFFSAQTFVFDLTLCGDWAGQSNVWGASSCSAQTPTCNQFVQTGANWINALWEVKYVKTYSVN